jgi:predicted nucleic acid-binding protein
MTFLLDVSALLAFGVISHEFHHRVGAWVEAQTSQRKLQLATCSITELGFVRILSQAASYGVTTAEARALLLKLKAQYAEELTFLSDDQDISRLPSWVQSPKQVTDGHLVQLARANDAVLATLDRGIPGAYLIPSIS